MTIFVLISEGCQNEARRHGLGEEIEQLRRRVEDTQSLSSFDQFPPPYYVKKKLKGRQPRLIAELRQSGQHSALVFLTIMIRGSKDYEEFSQNAVKYGEKAFLGLVSDDDVAAHVSSRTTGGDAPAKRAPTTAELEFLYSALSHANTNAEGASLGDLDMVVCESHEWVSQVARERIQTHLNRLADTCLGALELSEGLHKVPVTQQQGWHVWALRRDRYLLLTAVCDGTVASDTESMARAIAEPLLSGDVDGLLQSSRRAYPSLVLWDDELWIRLERETEANMALSPEETQVLTSARGLETPFPLFINGRAGSGKSTILQYLFADLLFAYSKKLTEDEAAVPEEGSLRSPLYLTANGELLRNAKNFVDRLLSTEAKFTLSADVNAGDAEDRQRAVLDTAFKQFHPFLLSLLRTDQQVQFPASGRLDYPLFRRKWQERFGRDPQARRDFGPDVSWHVVRSYIKGMGSDGYLDPEDYEQLPENQLTVSLETFTTIHKRVWEDWYSTVSEEGLWDDQDLVRFILEEDLAPRTYSAVFCDEAQDFTRIELEVLLRLSLYSDRLLASDAVRRVPFAFAGDEFQTLNPTGFRWDAVKAAFVEKFIFELDPSRRREKADLNYHELRYNYRSTRPIVHFGNLVQAIRSARFGITEIQPQLPWAQDGSATPVLYYPADDGEFWTAFESVSAGFVIIVPCLEGEEADFVRRDPVLCERVKVEDGVPRNVLSAGRAKGCEYPAVLVYGFGEAAGEDLVGTLGGSRSSAEDARQTLATQYFVNRVYVAVSRAKRRLLIVDTSAGIERLWKPAINEYARGRMLEGLRRGHELWAPALGSMNRGRASDLGADHVPDRRENARLFESDGRVSRDAYLMQQAANAYREAGELPKWRECRAWALDYDGKALEAGTAFAEAGMLDEARRCLWRAERAGWLKLLELGGQDPRLLSTLEVRWAKVVESSKPDPADALKVLKEFAGRLAQDTDFAQESFGEPVWELAVDRLLAPLTTRSPATIPAIVALGFVETLEQISKGGIRFPSRLRAEFCYMAEQYEAAAKSWEEIGETRTQRYLRAKARSVPYPDNLEFLVRLEDGKAAVSAAFDGAPEKSLNRDQSIVVSKVLCEAGRFEDALLQPHGSLPSDALVLPLAAGALKARREDLADFALNRAVSMACLEGDWHRIQQLMAHGTPLLQHESKDKAFRHWAGERVKTLQVTMIRALARSEALPNAPQRVEQQISGFLRSYLRVKDGKWIGQISLLEAGAAHERTGRHTDSIQFYEAALDGGRPGGEEAAQLQRRWIAVKARQLEYQKSREKVDQSAVARIEEEIKTQLKKWRIESSEIPEAFPVLEPLADRYVGSVVATALATAMGSVGMPQREVTSPLSTPTIAVAGVAPIPTQAPSGSPPIGAQVDHLASIGPLRIEASRAKKLCLITHDGTLDTLRIEWGAKSVRGTTPLEEVSPGCRWRVRDWGFEVSMEERSVSLGIADKGLRLVIET